MNRLCNKYLDEPGAVDLFRVLAIQKTVLATWATGGTIKGLTTWLRGFPRLKVSSLEKSLNRWKRAKKSPRRVTLKKKVHSLLSKGRISAAGKTIADPSCKVARVDETVKEQLLKLHPREEESKQSGKGEGLGISEEVLLASLKQTKSDESGGLGI